MKAAFLLIVTLIAIHFYCGAEAECLVEDGRRAPVSDYHYEQCVNCSEMTKEVAERIRDFCSKDLKWLTKDECRKVFLKEMNKQLQIVL